MLHIVFPIYVYVENSFLNYKVGRGDLWACRGRWLMLDGGRWGAAAGGEQSGEAMRRPMQVWRVNRDKSTVDGRCGVPEQYLRDN